MDISKYRKQTKQRVRRAQKQSEKRRASLLRSAAPSKSNGSKAKALRAESEAELAIGIAKDKSKPTNLRAGALQEFVAEISKDAGLISSVFGLLKGRDEPLLVRRTALGVLQIASFRSVMFTPHKAEYRATLRGLLDDADPSLREEALEILALQKDEYAHRRLLDGLEDEGKALVAPEKAITMLAEDIHADHFPLLASIVERKGYSVEARQEAVRLMAAHPDSSDLLTRLLTNKKENPKVRQASAVALQTLAPEQFEALAKQIALDPQEDAELRTTSISALTHFSNPVSLYADAGFAKGVKRVIDREGTSDLGLAAERLLEQQPR